MASSSSAGLDEDFAPSRYRGPVPQSPDRVVSSSRPDLTIYSWLDQPWRNEAACIDTDPMFFFPTRGEPGERIRELCFSCPVRLNCLDYSVTTMPKFGWYGGHPEEGRKKVRRLMRKGTPLDRADSIVLLESISRMDRKRKAEGDQSIEKTPALVG